MTTTQIILLILGIVILIISFFVIDRNEELENEITQIYPLKQMTESDILEMKHHIQSLTEEEISRSIEETRENLRRLSNETIMSVHDFSEQVLAKIEQNHEEVVFLYSMLTTKEEDYKKLYNKMEALKSDSIVTSMDKKECEQLTTTDKGNKVESVETLEKVEGSIHELTTEDATQNKTQAILQLYHQNYSVLDISKRLGIGQGEVQLVIGVYGKKSK